MRPKGGSICLLEVMAPWEWSVPGSEKAQTPRWALAELGALGHLGYAHPAVHPEWADLPGHRSGSVGWVVSRGPWGPLERKPGLS